MGKTAIACLIMGAATCASMALAQGPGGPGGRPMGRGMGGPRAERVVAGAPFSAVEVRQFQERLQDGNLITRTTQITRYRDSQGRTRAEETFTPDASSGKQAYTRITISDVVAGMRYELDSSTMTARSSKMRTANPAPRPASSSSATRAPRTDATPRTGPNGSTMSRVELGTQMVNGVSATGRQDTEVIPAGKMGNAQAITVVRTEWRSVELKMPVQVKTVDPRRGTSDMELTNIAQAEPSAALFVVPSGYTVKSGGRGARGAMWAGRGQAGSSVPQ